MPGRLRYPGLRPFNSNERHHFFGREKEIKEVCRLVDMDNLLVLHSPSGMGKSSLLNAGIIPSLRLLRNWEENVIDYKIPVRFSNYDPSMAQTRDGFEEKKNKDFKLRDPIDTFLDACEDTDPFFGQQLIPMPEPSLWLAIKGMIWDAWGEKIRWVFVLDQFEELFTYPEERVIEFAKQLGEIYQQELPEKVRRVLERKVIIEGEESFSNAMKGRTKGSKKFDGLLDWLRNEPLDVKILISMRSDKLNHLERIRPFIPNILNNSYELRSFSVDQAREAIVRPALLPHQFESPQFHYNPGVIEGIISHLQDNLTRRIDPSQLQIICQDIEKRMIEKNRKKNKGQS